MVRFGMVGFGMVITHVSVPHGLPRVGSEIKSIMTAIQALPQN
jgi:hypothetical protein